jgi:hypothetical protein
MTPRRPKHHTRRDLISAPLDPLAAFQHALKRQPLPDSMDARLKLWSALWARLNRRRQIRRHPQYGAALTASVALCGIDWNDPQMERRQQTMRLNNRFENIRARIQYGNLPEQPVFGDDRYIRIQQTLGQP